MILKQFPIPNLLYEALSISYLEVFSFFIFLIYTYGSGDTELRNIHITIEPFLSLAYQWVMTLQNT